MLGVVAFASIYGAGLTYNGNGPIRSDGLGYYVYLPATLLHDEVSMDAPPIARSAATPRGFLASGALRRTTGRSISSGSARP